LVGATVAAAGLLGAGLALPMQAQDKRQMPKVCVINVKKVFDASPKFKGEAETLKADMQRKEEELRTLSNAIQAKTQERDKYKVAADREPIEKQLNDLAFQFKTKQAKFREELSRAESAAVGTVYREMSTILSQYCQENGIQMVIRLDEPTKDMTEEMQVMTLMNRQVIYNHPYLDLSAVIAEGMAPAAGARPAANK